MKFAVMCLAAALGAGLCLAQGEEKKAVDDARYFRLDFVVKELEGGKVISARNYFTTVSSLNRENSSIRTGDKVPLPAGGGGSYNYLDVGVNIDARVVRATDTQLIIFLNADVSSFVPGASSGSSVVPPVVRQNRWSANVVVPMKKTTTVFSADGASEKRQMQIEVTAAPVL